MCSLWFVFSRNKLLSSDRESVLGKKRAHFRTEDQELRLPVAYNRDESDTAGRRSQLIMSRKTVMHDSSPL